MASVSSSQKTYDLNETSHQNQQQQQINQKAKVTFLIHILEINHLKFPRTKISEII
jgi:hypothetical protein